MRVPPGPYLRTHLRVHSFLADVPLRDVWPVMLQTRGPHRDIRDVKRILIAMRNQPTDEVIASLFRLRSRLGKLFGWELPSDRIPASSYIHRLTADDRAQTLILPGTIDPATGFREVYTFENETLLEITSNIVHAFVLMAIEPVAEGYIMYVAIYVKNISWFTPFYLALIDPFRRFIIYPVLIHDLEQAWSDLYAKTARAPVRRR